MSYKHSEFISGPGFSAFIDGVPDECEHQYDGETAYLIESSNDPDFNPQWVKESEIHEYPGDTFPEKFHNWNVELRDKGLYNSTGCCTCSKCGKLFSPEVF